tara:strand:+ start:2360 stop:2530 length:171 start_codon:yes stop_codon:yes gene_type:complete
MALARSVDPDVARIRDRMASSPVTDSVAKDICTCNSWRRDPEPRLHTPIITNRCSS